MRILSPVRFAYGPVGVLAVEAPLAEEEVAELPATKAPFAELQRACIPPEEYMTIVTAIKATKAVSRQYSARSCPRSSVRKAVLTA